MVSMDLLMTNNFLPRRLPRQAGARALAWYLRGPLSSHCVANCSQQDSA